MVVPVADGVFNIAKGRVAELHHRVDANDPSTSVLVVVLLASTGLEADATLKDYDTLSAILAAANDEATNTNYARKVLTDADISDFTTNDTSDRNECDIADQTWTSVSNDGTGAIGKLLICYDAITGSGADADIVPLTYHDFTVTPNGGNIVASISDYFRAS